MAKRKIFDSFMRQVTITLSTDLTIEALTDKACESQNGDRYRLAVEYAMKRLCKVRAARSDLNAVAPAREDAAVKNTSLSMIEERWPELADACEEIRRE